MNGLQMVNHLPDMYAKSISIFLERRYTCSFLRGVYLLTGKRKKNLDIGFCMGLGRKT